MLPRLIIKIIIEKESNEKQAIEHFCSYGYTPHSAKLIMKEFGIYFPPIQNYDDLHPSPERIQKLQELSTSS